MEFIQLVHVVAELHNEQFPKLSEHLAQILP